MDASRTLKLKMVGDTTQVESAFRGLKTSAGPLKDALAGVGLGLAGVAAGAEAVRAVYQSTVAPTLEYELSVLRLAKAYGVTTEEMSRIIQVADDLGISQATLEVAFKRMAANEIQPSIEGLGKLAAAYNALPTPEEKATFAQDNFGKSAVDMARLMDIGTASIVSNTAAVDDNLVVTAAQAEQAERLRVAQDAWNDSLQGFAYVAGNIFIPVASKLTDSATRWLKVMEQLQKDIASGKVPALALRDAYIALGEGSMRAADQEQYQSDYLRELQRNLNLTRAAAEDAPEPWKVTNEVVTVFTQQGDPSNPAAPLTTFIPYGGQVFTNPSTGGKLTLAPWASAADKAYARAHPELYNQGFARGGEFDVPPGFPNDSAQIKVSSGEHVKVTPAGASDDRVLGELRALRADMLRANRALPVLLRDAVERGR